MIDRYCTDAIEAIWSRQAKYQRWLEVELAICEAWHRRGVIPADDMAAIRGKADFTLERCDELELETRHDLVAFVRCIEEFVGAPGRWVHFGVTSYDVIDTALAMMLRDTCAVLLESGNALHQAIVTLHQRFGDAPMMGRTHGIHAEPVTFGHKCEGWRNELDRNLSRIARCQEDIAYGKISGAVGIHAHVEPDMEIEICASLGLKADPSTTQIVNRDRHANMINVLALLGAGLERIATELRNLQRTEILEVQESFAKGQTGSSAMPHKRNPWNSETVCGLARVLRGNATAMLESVATWHERDLTNSSLERVVLPDSCHLADFMIKRMTRILSGLEVFPDRMKSNMRLMGDLVFSEHLMVALVGKGLLRAEAYKVAQRNAARAWEGHDFATSVRDDETVRAHLTPNEVDELFSLEHHLRHAPKPPQG